MTWNPEQAEGGKAQPLHSRRSAFQVLPAFYVQAVTRPSARFFAHTAEYARWGLVWLQLLFIVLIPLLVGLIRTVVSDHSTGVSANSNIFISTLGIVTAGASFFAYIIKIIAIPIVFFVGVGLQYVVAKIFRGRGKFVSHCFSMQTYQVPLTIITGLLTLVFVFLHLSTLFFSPLISLAAFAYGVFINIAVVRGVHSVDREKAILAVLIPYIVGLLAICGTLAAIAHAIAGTINSLR